MVEFQPLEPPSINDNVLHSLGMAMRGGREFTRVEDLMAMTASARKVSESYGPSPAQMRLEKPELPENVKGILAQYAV